MRVQQPLSSFPYLRPIPPRSSQVRHRIVSVVVFIFFISLLSCCGGVLAALAGSWRPHGIAAAGYPWPSGEILVRNLLLPDDKVSFHDFRNVLSVRKRDKENWVLT